MMKKSNPVPPREVDAMTREEAMEIIRKENLKYYNLFGQHPYGRFEVVIQKDGDEWVTFMIDERREVATSSELFFENEWDAWDDFIRRLRIRQELQDLYSTFSEY